MRVIIGAGQSRYDGWLSTQEDDLDFLTLESWNQLTKPDSIDALLAEHVWEHLTYNEGAVAAKHCYQYLKPGGYIRCAVPDKNFRNDWYQQMVQVGGPGPADQPAASHKVVYDAKTFVSVFEGAGFEVTLLEYCKENGDFQYTYWNEMDGMIGRSLRFDTRNSTNKLGMLSIIIDAKKPLLIRNNS
ncbi:class I SAM-dependent methyltransferase [Paenibacillus sp. FSL K6-2862]|uniref:class I SAM-dependent methyltransferase n=1 Tax=Paenibacillus sp. FSL K6-2862 TaxID=2921484 RepID=UPI0030F987DF